MATTKFESNEGMISYCINAYKTIEEYFDLDEMSEKFIPSFSLWRPNLSGVKRKNSIDIESMKEILESLTKIQDIIARNKNTPKQHKEILESKDCIPLIKGAIYVLQGTKQFVQGEKQFLQHDLKNLNTEELKSVKKLFESILKNIKEPTIDNERIW